MNDDDDDEGQRPSPPTLSPHWEDSEPGHVRDGPYRLSPRAHLGSGPRSVEANRTWADCVVGWTYQDWCGGEGDGCTQLLSQECPYEPMKLTCIHLTGLGARPRMDKMSLWCRDPRHRGMANSWEWRARMPGSGGRRRQSGKSPGRANYSWLDKIGGETGEKWRDGTTVKTHVSRRVGSGHACCPWTTGGEQTVNGKQKAFHHTTGCSGMSGPVEQLWHWTDGSCNPRSEKAQCSWVDYHGSLVVSGNVVLAHDRLGWAGITWGRRFPGE